MQYCQSTNEKVRNFATYFVGQYVNHNEYMRKWPKCFGGMSPNTNMALENFHSQLKNLYMERGANLRLDKLVYNLVVKSRDDLFARIRKAAKNPYHKRNKVMADQHRASSAILTGIQKAGSHWLVTSKSGEIHRVTLAKDDCHIHNCLRCKVCGICRHMVSCDCNISTKSRNLCIHAHTVCIHNLDVVSDRFPERKRDVYTEVSKYEKFVAVETNKDVDIAQIKARIVFESAQHWSPEEAANFYEKIEAACPSSPRFMNGKRPAVNKLQEPQRTPVKKRKIL